MLRHAWHAKASVSSSTYMEVTNSVTVQVIDKGFLVKWVRNGDFFEKEYLDAEFKFFIQGDKVKEGDDNIIDYKTNNEHAIEFVKEALNIDEISDRNSRKPLLMINPLTLLGYTIIASLLWISEGKGFFISFILLLLLFVSEFWYIKGKLFVPLILMGFIYTGFVFTALIGLIIFIVIQLFDPNGKLRHIRVSLSAVTLLSTSLYIIWSRSIPVIDLWIIAVICGAIGGFLVTWTRESHFRSFPLVFPFLSIGMYLDGHIELSIMTIACSFVAVIFNVVAFKLLPVQKEKLLNSNG